ncbi:MAG: hypothetical protein WDM77_04640 [Steroidobacteraceae bacterium]
MSKKFAVLILALGAAANAQAGARLSQFLQSHSTSESQRPSGAPAAAPEIDPASAMSAFTLLAGGLVMIRGRRAAKSSSK